MQTSNTKKSVRKSLLSVLLIAALLITGVFAFLTATTETKVNTFTVGSIKIELDEGPWDEFVDEDNDGIPDVAEEVVSGQITEKAPSIKNVGSNDAYGFIAVSIPKAAEVVVADNNGVVSTKTNHELFELLDAEGNPIALTVGTQVNGWTLKAIETDDVNLYNHYLFAYDSSIASSSASNTLFSSVRFANVTEEFSGNTAKELVVKVSAYAIQKDADLTDVDTAQTALLNDMGSWVPEI